MEKKRKNNILITFMGLIITLLILLVVGIVGTMVFLNNNNNPEHVSVVDQEKTIEKTDNGYKFTTPLLNPITRYEVGSDLDAGIYTVYYKSTSSSQGKLSVYNGSQNTTTKQQILKNNFNNNNSDYKYNNLVLEENDSLDILLENGGEYELVKQDDIISISESEAGMYRLIPDKYTLKFSNINLVNSRDDLYFENYKEDSIERYYVESKNGIKYFIGEQINMTTNEIEIIFQDEITEQYTKEIDFNQVNNIYLNKPYNNIGYSLEIKH